MENFTIAGEDKVFYPAKAEIYSNRVYVFSPRVANPKSVRYCFDDGAMGELFTSGGIPISSFRTDSW